MPTKGNDQPDWEDIKIGLGTEVVLEVGESFDGNYLGTATTQVDEREQIVHQFSPENDPGIVNFLWGAYELDAAMQQVEAGTLVRVTFTGRKEIASGRQPMKTYRVQVAR